MADKHLLADGERGLLHAYISPDSRFVAPLVADRKLSAVLHPYRDEETARAALIAAGGKDVREGDAK